MTLAELKKLSLERLQTLRGRRAKRIRRLQAVRQRLRRPRKAARRRGLRGVAIRIRDGISQWLKKRIDENHDDLKKIEDAIEWKRAAQENTGAKLYEWAKAQLGTRQGSSEWQSWMNLVGGYDPWCSFFVGAGLIKAAGYSRSQLPGSLGYSGAWLSWSGGERVSVASRRRGDLLIFDYGDGGITDHVAICEDAGHHIGGNQSDAVTRVATPVGAVVGVVRIK